MNHPPTGPPSATVSPEELFDVVCGAASQNPALVQSSTTRLKELLNVTGAYDILQEIAATKSVALPVRQQAIIQFKNAATGHWRSRKLFPPEIKTRIRDRCLTFLDETDDIISECNALVVAKIARQDYPPSWPQLVPHLAGAINTSIEARYNGSNPNATVLLRRSLELLNAILKEFAAYKMLTGVKTMGQLVRDLQLPLQAHYARFGPSLLSLTAASLGQVSTVEDLLLSHLIYKSLSRLAFWAYHRCKCCHDYEDLAPWVHEVFQNSAVQLRALSELRINLVSSLSSSPDDPITQRALELLTRHVRIFGKLFRRMQRDAPASFVALPMCGDLVLYYWSKVVQATTGPSDQIADTSYVTFPVRFLVQGMALFRDSLAQWAPKKKDGSPNDRVLSKEFVEDAVKILVTRFIPLNPTDLEGWMEDPEEWVNTEEKENDQWEYELRPCAERVLMTLATQYPQYVRPLIELTFNQVVGQNSMEISAIIQKEALYCAVGRCAIRLKESIPFEQWLDTTLVAEAQVTEHSYAIVKRRIAWLLGKLVSDECLRANNPKLWQVLVHLLQDQGPGSDAVVRLTAAIAIRECVDSLNFDADVFAPFLPTVVSCLVRLTADADTLEAKRRITDSLNTVIERAEGRIVPLMGMVAEPIPQLWTTAAEDWLFKACLLGTVTKLVEAAKENANSLSGLVVPLVRDCFNSPAQMHLDGDAFLLWQSALRNTTTIDGANGAPGLIDLVPLIIQQLSSNLDVLGTIVHIVESYILLDAPRILQLGAVDLLRAFNTAIDAAPGTNIKQMTTALCLLFQITPPALWGEALHVSGLFATIVKGLDEEKLSVLVLTEYVYVLARIALADRQLFVQLVSATAASQKTKESLVWEPILNQWWNRFDNMSEPRLRKLTAMGIASLVATGHPDVLDRLATEIFNLWIDVFGEIKEQQQQNGDDGCVSSVGLGPLTLYWDKPFEDVYTDAEGTPEYQRRKAVFENDPVRTTALQGFVGASLQAAEAACGGAAELQAKYLSKADPLLLKQIGDAVSGVLP
ncbi:ARM repeat-containing protein [Trametes elegans]|nr:ARM repeat-containing protein [Trametes elegans]